MDLNRLFVLNMKKWRKSRGLSQKALAERCQAAHGYIRQIESGGRMPSFVFIGKLAQAMNIDAYQLFYDETLTERGDAPPPGHLEALKTEILTQMSAGIDEIITEARKKSFK